MLGVYRYVVVLVWIFVAVFGLISLYCFCAILLVAILFAIVCDGCL